MNDDSIHPWLTIESLPHFFCSYAQNFEDVILARVFQGRSGFYIDAGANDPVHDSVTKHFYNKGWSGVNLEPHELFHRKLCSERPRDINLRVGLSNREAVTTFHEVPSGKGISSLFDVFSDWNVGQRVEQRPIEITTLSHVCEKYADRQIDFLKIDVEGAERDACEGGDWARWRPKIVLIEAPFENTFEDWDLWFQDRDYQFAYFDRINRFYVRNEDRELLPALSTPLSSLDRAIPYHQIRLIRQLEAELQGYRNRASNSGCDETDLGTSRGSIVGRIKRMTVRRFHRSTLGTK